MIHIAITTAWLSGVILLAAPLMRLVLRIALVSSFVIAEGFGALTWRPDSHDDQSCDEPHAALAAGAAFGADRANTIRR